MHTDSEVTAALILLLAQRGDKTALPAIGFYLRSDNAAARMAVYQALSSLGDDEESVRLLVRAIMESKGDEQRAARDSLDQMKYPAADAALAKLFEKFNENTQKEIAARLAARNATSAVPMLVGQLQNADTGVRAEVLKALGALGAKESISPVLNFLLKTELPAELDQAAKTVVAMAHRMPEGELRDDGLVAALTDAKESVRIALLNNLAQTSGSNVFGAIHVAMKDPSDNVQNAAFRALANWPDAKPMDELLEIARTSKMKRTASSLCADLSGWPACPARERRKNHWQCSKARRTRSRRPPTANSSSVPWRKSSIPTPFYPAPNSSPTMR